MMNDYIAKRNELKQRLSSYLQEDVVVAFSGGVDSSILLKMCVEAAQEHGSKVYAFTAHTRLHPACDLEIAKRVCQETGAIHKVITIDELKEAGIIDNPINRCYLCKYSIFHKIKQQAELLGVHTILEGTNEDDLHVYRPGIQALKELSIVSPLADCGITKQEVRYLAEDYDISVAKRPSTPCMATRFPYGSKLDYEQLAKVEEGEEWLREAGFYNIRLRVHGDVLRIEVDEEDFEKLLSMKTLMIQKMKEIGYRYITLDLEGFRSGSMDLVIESDNK